MTDQYSFSKKNSSSVSAASHQLKSKNGAANLVDNRPASLIQRKPNNTGLPDQLKSGIENISGYSMDDVKVHYNSSRPAQLNAYAYAQGTDIHIAAGQQKHLPHEAWHVVQQKQGRVQATTQLKSSVPLNDDEALEKEADKMGAKAMQLKAASGTVTNDKAIPSGGVVQRNIFNKFIGNTVSDIATLVGGSLLGIGGPTALNAPSYGPRTGRGFGTYMDVRLNTPDPGTATGSGDDNPTWVALSNRRLGSRSYYVQAHLLSEKLGGSGTNWLNLVPLTNASNLQMERIIESHVKLASAGNTVGYKVQAIYGQWPWQWPSYWVNMLTSPWLPLLMPGIYSTIASLRDAEQHVPSAVYAQWWVVDGAGSWIPFVRRITQKPNSGGGFWVYNEADNQVYDMNKAVLLWKAAEHAAATYMMPVLLPKLISFGLSPKLAAALTPTQFLRGLTKTSTNLAGWMFRNNYNLDVYFDQLNQSRLRILADVLLNMLGVKVDLTTGASHSANRETVDMLQSVNQIDAPYIHALPARTTKSGAHF
jgi:hypothetical protein